MTANTRAHSAARRSFLRRAAAVVMAATVGLTLQFGCDKKGDVAAPGAGPGAAGE